MLVLLSLAAAAPEPKPEAEPEPAPAAEPEPEADPQSRLMYGAMPMGYGSPIMGGYNVMPPAVIGGGVGNNCGLVNECCGLADQGCCVGQCILPYNIVEF